MSEPQHDSDQGRLKTLLGHEFFAPAQWQRRVALWTGGVLVGLAAIAFARGSDYAFRMFQRIESVSPLIPLVLTPAMFILLAWLTQGVLKPTRGSGIPQVIASLQIEDSSLRQRLLSLPVALGKMALTLMALLGGASVGREGPTGHVGAGLMYWLGRRFGFSDPKAISRFILAGGGAGIVSLGVMGDYAYFGRVDAVLPLGQSLLAALMCGICGGIGGGIFARMILPSKSGVLGYVTRLRRHSPVLFAGACGLALAMLGVFSGSAVFGTGYAEAHALVQATHGAGASFGLLKLAANILSYWAGIPGGIFSPALAVGAGMGNTLAGLLPNVDTSAVVLLGMAAFLSGVTQAPLTSAVISLELTANNSMVIPIMAVCLLSRAASSVVCPVPIYRALATSIVEDFEPKRMV